jgi:hypothetical protein
MQSIPGGLQDRGLDSSGYCNGHKPIGSEEIVFAAFIDGANISFPLASFIWYDSVDLVT